MLKRLTLDVAEEWHEKYLCISLVLPRFGLLAVHLTCLFAISPLAPQRLFCTFFQNLILHQMGFLFFFTLI